MTGISLSTFGLEANNVVSQLPGQTNFNVFYLLCDSCQEEGAGLQALKLRSPESFHFLANASPPGGVTDSISKFITLQGAMENLDFRVQDIEAVWCTLAAILHIGQLEFGMGDRGAVIVRPYSTVKVVASLLKLEVAKVNTVLASLGQGWDKTMGARYPRAELLASAHRDALCRILYQRVFNFVVQQINDTMCSAEECDTILAVLDPPGGLALPDETPGNFSLLLRNFIHERMQQHFNQQMFVQQQNRMEEEKIVSLSELEYPDNNKMLELLERKGGGMIHIIEEVEGLPQSRAEALFSKLQTSFTGHENFVAVQPENGKPLRLCSLKHSFGSCQYSINSFLDIEGDDSFSPALQMLQGATRLKLSLVASAY